MLSRLLIEERGARKIFVKAVGRAKALFHEVISYMGDRVQKLFA